MQAVIMAAGKSTRTYPLTLTRPKPLLPVLNRPLLAYNLEQLDGLVDEVILIVGYRQEMIRNAFGNSFGQLKLTYQEQREQLGTGHAVLQVRHLIKGPFLVLNGDDLFARQDMEKLLDVPAGALVKEVENPSLYGVYTTDQKNRVVDLIEKPKNPVSRLANVGCYHFPPEIFTYLEKTPKSERGEIELTSAVLGFAKEHPFYTVLLEGYWLPTGYAWDLLKTQVYFFDRSFSPREEGTIEEGVSITGPVAIGRGAVIGAGTVLRGPVMIGENSQIGPHSFVGPYTCIGKNVRVGAASILEHSLLFDGVTLGYRCLVKYSVIGQDVQIGDNLQVIDAYPDGRTVRSLVKGKRIDCGLSRLGTVVGDRAKLASRTVIYPGCKIWPEKVTTHGETVSQDLLTVEPQK